jgi:AcrR family transcriptional regulator
MRLFWMRGYEATSVGDLAEALGIHPPSLYAAFGDKRCLFAEVVARYEAGPGGYGAALLSDHALATREAVGRLLHDAAAAFTRPCDPHGCLVVLAATNCGAETEDVAADLAARRRRTEAAIRARVERGQAVGDVAPDVDAGALAGLVAATLFGMSVKARDGAPRAELDAMVERLMAMWSGAG